MFISKLKYTSEIITQFILEKTIKPNHGIRRLLDWFSHPKDALEKIAMLSFIVYPFIQSTVVNYLEFPNHQNGYVPYLVSLFGLIMFVLSFRLNKQLHKKILVIGVFVYMAVLGQLMLLNEFNIVVVLWFIISMILSSSIMDRYTTLILYNLYSLACYIVVVFLGRGVVGDGGMFILGCLIAAVYSIATYSSFIFRERELEQQRDELIESRNELQFILDSISVMITFKDDQNRIVKVNKAQRNRTRFTDEDLPIPLEDIIGKEEADKFFLEDKKIMESGNATLGDISTYFSETMGVQHIRTDSYPYFKNGEIKGVVVMGMDVTKEEEYRRALEDKTRSLENSNEELEAFAYAVSHDLKEPLRMISGYMQLLERRYKDQLDDSAREFIHYAVDGAQRMNQLIEGILDFSRVGRYNTAVSQVDMNDICDRILFNLQLKIEEENASVKVEKLPVIFANATEMQTLFQNLIGNALKYTKDGVVPQVGVMYEELDEQLVFKVSDNGIGMENEHKELIFALFQRLHTREQFQGSGIGLAISKKIVERNQGRIWVESQPGEGSTFFVAFPKSIAH